MSARPLEITFHLDGTGFYFDPAEPLHLDSLLTYLLAPFHKKRVCISRDDMPDFIPLPLTMWCVGDHKGWRASALFPSADKAGSIMYWRKKFRQHRIELTKGSPNLTNATYREYNTPMPLCVCNVVKAWCVGNRGRIHQLLRRVKYLGKKSSMGRGHVVNVTVVHCEEDWSLVRDGKAQRWLPLTGAPRLVRTIPPYWNNHNRVQCCEVQQEYDINLINKESNHEHRKA